MTSWKSVILAAELIFLPDVAMAQGTADGAVRGYMRDEQGAAVPGVTIVASSPTVGGTRETVSDPEGFYRLTNLPPGEYTISAELAGFARFVRPGIVVRAGINFVVDIVA